MNTMMMKTKLIGFAVVCAGLALSACTAKEDEDPMASGPGEEGPAEDMTTTGPVTTGPDTNETAEPATTAGPGPGEGSTGAEEGTGAVFLVPPDGGGVGFECDLFVQDCPAGEKCMPWANDGGTWNATRCSPVADNPGQPGDECTVEGSSASGIDDCDLGAQCWDVDGETNIGTCVAMCTGDESNPICEDPGTTCSIANEGAIVLCLPICDPLLQDCPDGNACYPVAEDWVCGPDASGEQGAYGDPCEFINVCDPGLACLDPATVPAGEACEGAAGCCSEVCDLTDPAGNAQCSGAAGGQECLPWYEEGAVPPGYEDVGYCSIPA